MLDTRRRKLLMLLMGGGAPLTMASYMASLNLLVWLRLRETSGTTAANSGTLGAAADSTFTPGTGAVAQTGQLGVNEAYSFDALNTMIQVPSFADISTYTYGFLVKANSAGEGSAGRLFADNLGARTFRINSVNLNLRAFNTSQGGTTADSVTANNFITTGAWHYIFVTFDINGDKKLHIYKYISGALTEASYTTNVAMTIIPAATTGVQTVGNVAAQSGTWDGLIDEVFIANYALSVAQMTQIGQLALLT